ncbi:hypothetical protein FFK22_007750 [Mycobacterium sp. KBS0706]|uniref:WD40/YVTN/BNR-like repeat-containing protein n=1 Tax=Mycobacterium sp. KBS0706 TaxID=2578109 RepID=UPI00110F9C17|nr:hypothetical protein [Mycobacterium sp. KBS0706]TSD89380.1 hypothetical protein FFK22_007750 [Mycobacterium sp. KBS0706]
MNHRLMAVLLAALLLFVPGLGHAQLTWKPGNPGGGGAFNSPVVTSEGYWAVGSDLGGVYLSMDAGATWTAVGSAQGLTVTHIASLAAHPSGKLLVGTDGGLFVGNSNGTGFSRKYATGYIAAIAVSADPNIVYAAVHPQWDSLSPYIIRSNDAGQTWAVTGSNLPTNLRITGLRTHPVDPDGVWAVSGRGRFPDTPESSVVYQAHFSTDGGATFARMDPQQGKLVDIAYGLDPSNLNLMYATVAATGNAPRVYKSVETGFSWTLLTSGTQAPSGIILADSTNASHVRIVGLDDQSLRPAGTYGSFLWESSNAGTSWTKYTLSVSGGWSQADEDWGMGYSYQGLGQTIGARPSSPNTVLWTNNQFLYSSSNGGKTWADGVSTAVSGKWRSRGIDNVVPIVVEQSAADANVVYAGYMDLGLWRSDDGGLGWTSLNTTAYTGGWGGKGGNSLSVAADPGRANVVWAQLGGNMENCGTPCAEPLYLLKSTDKGATWQNITQGLPNPIRRLEGLTVAPDSTVTYRWVYAAVNGDVYLSEDDGVSWAKVLDCPNDDCFRVYYTDTNGVLALSAGAVYRSWQGGSAGTWDQLTLPATMTSGWTAGQHWLHDVWTYSGPMDLASRGGNIWVAVKGTGKGLYRSADYGQSWTRVRADDQGRTVAVNASTGRVYFGSSSAVHAGGYATTSQGVVTSADGATGWTAQNQGLAFPFALYARVAANGALWLVSPGQGVIKWR